MGEVELFHRAAAKWGFAQFRHARDESVQSSSLRPSAARLRSGKSNQMNGLQTPQGSGSWRLRCRDFCNKSMPSGVDDETV